MGVSTLATLNDLKTYHSFPALPNWCQGRWAWWMESNLVMNHPFWPAANFSHRYYHEQCSSPPARATMLTKRVDIIYFIDDSSTNQIPASYPFFCCSKGCEINHANWMRNFFFCLCLSSVGRSIFVSVILYIRLLPESSVRTRAAWPLAVSSLLTPIFLSSSGGQGPHAQQTPEPWCLHVIKTTRLALQGNHWFFFL